MSSAPKLIGASALVKAAVRSARYNC